MPDERTSTELYYWGWIPILSHAFYIACQEPDECIKIKEFSEINDSDFNRILSENFIKEGASYSTEAILSDDFIDRSILKIKHKIEILKLNQSKNNLNLRIIIYKPYSLRVLVDGIAEIYPNGLVRYKLAKCKGKKIDCASQVHKIVRDIFHKHEHHSSDLLLPLIQCNKYDDAIYEIAKIYIQKFIEYKRFSSKVRPKDALEDLHRGMGEIAYAKVFLNINKNILNDDHINFSGSIDSFLQSFSILLERLQDRIKFGTNDMLIGLTAYLVVLTTILSRSELMKISAEIFSQNVDYSINLFILIFFSFGFPFATYFTTSSLLMLTSPKDL